MEVDIDTMVNSFFNSESSFDDIDDVNQIKNNDTLSSTDKSNDRHPETVQNEQFTKNQELNNLMQNYMLIQEDYIKILAWNREHTKNLALNRKQIILNLQQYARQKTLNHHLANAKILRQDYLKILALNQEHVKNLARNQEQIKLNLQQYGRQKAMNLYK